MSEPVVSVLMPVYNTERYVGEAIQSILNQSFRDFEFVIVDDGSTDESLVIIQEHASRDSRIRVVSRPNTGYVVALNQMIELSTGEFIARMDADDISLPTRLQSQLDFLERNSNVMVVGSASRWIDPEGDILREYHPPLDSKDIDEAHLSKPEAVICHPSAMIRRTVFEQCGHYNPDLFGAEDLDLWLRAAELGKLANLPDVLLQYRFHQSKVGVKHRERQLASATTAVKDACKRRGIMPSSLLCQQEVLQDDDQYLIWGWWALSAGNVLTARKYARRLVRQNPWKIGNWKFFCCAVRGY